MYSKEQVLEALEKQIDMYMTNGPSGVMSKLDTADKLSEAKQALGVLQGMIMGLKEFKETVVRWED